MRIMAGGQGKQRPRSESGGYAVKGGFWLNNTDLARTEAAKAEGATYARIFRLGLEVWEGGQGDAEQEMADQIAAAVRDVIHKALRERGIGVKPRQPRKPAGVRMRPGA